MRLPRLHRSSSLALATGATVLFLGSAAAASTARYRLSYRADPSSSIVIGWDQTGGSDATVYYDTTDHGTDVGAYAMSHGVDRSVNAFGMDNRFARLTGLTPDTAYYFVIADASGTSQRFWFKTAPDTLKPFSLVAGGDSRNNRTPRRNGNRAVAKLRPLAVMFGGDFTDSNTSSQWVNWMDDWQDSISADGRIYPLMAARGNHDSNGSVHDLFDTPNSSNYYALPLAGGLARLYALNSEITPGGSQGSWLAQDLADHRCVQFQLAHYHKPMRPHTSGKSNGNSEYDAWADLFHDEGVDLVVECDSHTVKRTHPISPSNSGDEGFVRDDTNGTTYIGEGCWGAPLRSNDDAKAWTMAHGRFNQVNWIQVHVDRLEIRTVATDNIGSSASVSDANPFAVPSGLPLWTPGSGTVVTLPARALPSGCSGIDPGDDPDPGAIVTPVKTGDSWRYWAETSAPAGEWRAIDYNDGSWSEGASQLGYGDGDEATTINASASSVPSYYFRRNFEVSGTVTSAALSAVFDDAIAVWINGTLVAAENMSVGYDHGTYSGDSSGDDADLDTLVDSSVFVSGTNVVAAMVKQRSSGSSDVSFDLTLQLEVEADPDPGTGGSGSGGASSTGGSGAGGASSSGGSGTGGDGSGIGGSSSGTGGSDTGTGGIGTGGSGTGTGGIGTGGTGTGTGGGGSGMGTGGDGSGNGGSSTGMGGRGTGTGGTTATVGGMAGAGVDAAEGGDPYADEGGCSFGSSEGDPLPWLAALAVAVGLLVRRRDA